MALLPGQTLAHYEIIGALGAGAMGEVYRARDTRLEREVAIKVLPEHFAGDDERLRRFEREAKALASLNHPCIAQIHDVDRHGETYFLALELVPGETLEDRLKHGPLGVDEALDVAKQVAEGLEAAHEAGVIHRDLKPANIRIAPDGRVKLLDFGLAKPTHAPGDARATDSVLTTEAGRLIGTPTYMAPEQARGRPIDKRVDVWAFGCVLYECLTGRRAFTGETLTDVFAAVLRTEPDLARLPAETPRRTRELLERCLAKDPKLRLRDIGEARILLADRSSDPEPARATRVPWLLVLGAAVLAFGAGALLQRDSTLPARPLWRFSRLTDLPGAETNPDLSPDGNLLAFASFASGNSDIWLLRVGGTHAIDLTEGCPLDDGQPAFSPDGQLIAFRSERDGGGLFVMGATGESVRRLTDHGHDPTWSPDGRFVAFASEPVDDPLARMTLSALWTVEVATGTVRRLLEEDAMQPAWSPDGRWIAYWTNTRGQRDIVLIAPSGGDPIPVTQDAPSDWSPAWSSDGRRLFFSSDRAGSMDVWSVAIDPGSGRAQGEPRPETSGVRGLAFAGFAADGRRMVCMAYDRSFDVEVQAFDPETEKLTPRFVHRRQTLDVTSLSPDGAWIAGSTMGTREDLVLVRIDGSESRRLMNDAAKDRTPKWSPDGSLILFKSTRTGRWQPWSIRADGSGLTQVAELGTYEDVVWSPDGTQIVMRIGTRGERAVIRLDPRRSNDAASFEHVSDAPEVQDFIPEVWSPRGALLAGTRHDEAGVASEIGILDLDTQRYRPLSPVPIGIGWEVVGAWLPDGRRIVCRTRDGFVCHDVESGQSKVLAPCGPNDRFYASRDGRTVVLVRAVLDADVWLGESN